jgi:cysteinyl-tRNA synthetase
MREFVGSISEYAKEKHESFIIVPQNGHELVTSNGETDSEVQYDYLAAIDGAGQEDLFFGYDADDRATETEDSEYLNSFLTICETNGIEVLVTDYCSSKANVEYSYSINEEHGFISYAAEERELNIIPGSQTVYNENDDDILQLSDAKNFLYLINPDNFQSITSFVDAVSNTNYDLLIIDLFHKETELGSDDIARLKTKANGGERLVLAYMSIGEAEDYRYYWKNEWKDEAPEWLDRENAQWKGNYKVEYWNQDWQTIIFGSENSYLDKIINAGFDGVYLDIIEAFEYFE